MAKKSGSRSEAARKAWASRAKGNKRAQRIASRRYGRSL